MEGYMFLVPDIVFLELVKSGNHIGCSKLSQESESVKMFIQKLNTKK